MSSTLQQPGAVKALNRVGGLLGRAGLRVGLDPNGLKAAARKSTGLDDFGPYDFHEGLLRLTTSLEQEAQLTPLGRVAARKRIISLLETRLRLEARAHLVEAEQITRPVFVLGLPGTATAALHGMLASDPAMRIPASWEVAHPFPAPSAEDPERIALTAKELDALRKIAPGIDGTDRMDPLRPQDCLALQAPQFVSYEFPMTFPVPSYWAWLRAQDMRPSYAFEKLLLQHLQSGGLRGEHWLLGSPCHVMWLDALLDVFPDALLVHAHRNPTTALASIASAVLRTRSALAGHVDPAAVGREQLEAWTWGMQNVLLARERVPSERVVDVHVHETVDHPVETVERVYAHLGLHFSATVADGVRRYLAAHPRSEQTAEEVSLEDLGLDRAEVDAAFADYRTRFGVPD